MTATRILAISFVCK